MEYFEKFGWLLFWICIPAAAAGIVLYAGDFERKPLIGFLLVIAAITPLALLCQTMIHEYGPMPWFPTSSGTLHFYAGLIFALSLVAILVLSRGSKRSKVILAITATIGWLIWWFISTLLTACAMGDCL
jgi:hypothetical protein